ncbi:extracellular catalytic domain type 1 short-chain-length polyhydroxyalkanoate depolymerase [Massilia niastensis]|uniref:extracellular catalytic domain type 1 short-chain-length polyhydroxyalkanoate depolymerase n=1 Tax=Massilia niastensis TaxID=544911 RepID=UPI00036B5FB1|nr:PHB depolymerase family esterase [Massilia niastensis]
MLHTMLDTWTSLAFGGFGAAPLLPGSLPASERGAGQFTSGLFESDAGSLHYKLFVPSTYDGTPLPLVVMLHGCGQNADDFALGTGMNELAEQFGCLVVYPEQSRGANWQGCWNWFEKAHHERDQGEPALIAGITQKIIADYAVDRTRVGIAGLSAGGSMAVILGRTYPDLYTAVGCHSGLAHGSATDSFGAMQAMRHGADVCPLVDTDSTIDVPVIVFHGDMDDTVHLSNSMGVVRQSIEASSARVTDDDAEVLTEDAGAATRAFTRSVHRGQAGEVLAEHWTVHGAGHAWSGGSRRGTYTDAHGPDASKEMLRFFIGAT